MRIAPETLLCEQCGYVLESLEHSGSCPECGKLIWESLPERRRGTAFQSNPTVFGWMHTFVQVHTSPIWIWRQVCVVHPVHSLLLICANCSVAMVVAFVLARLMAGPGVRSAVIPAAVSGWLPLAALGCGVFLVVLTLIEARGVAFFSRRRNWRVPMDLALAICAHAAATWWIAAAGTMLGLALSSRIADAVASLIAGNALLTALVPTSGPLLGFVLGMLVFETLVYIGVRECKFANRPRAEAA